MTGSFEAWVGRRAHAHDRVTSGLVRRFAATLDAADADATTAPQGIHWCLCLPEAPTGALSIDGHPPRGDFLPPVDLPRRMWAASDMRFLAPITGDSHIERVSTIAGIRETQGASGPLVFVEVDHATLANGVAAVHERQTLVYRAAASAAPPPALAPDRAPRPAPSAAAWDWQRSIVPTETLLFRYSALTFNSHRIHYDQAYASQVEGYAGLVVQGPLMATLLLDLCARQLGSNALAHFAFRAVSPAIAGEPLQLAGRREADQLVLAVLGPGGRTVMSATATPKQQP